ncbi:hypothetical protein MCUN1_003835 [Malassezia cuniculi]|uniref:THO complex subunit 7 n=1 Tax=Malassezia cuniculi TaxID=948313 RepID=A0AAF0J859_9BASI|nr:hypothetical protein MCUN1_003835 [Malassezia cuniculi]
MAAPRPARLSAAEQGTPLLTDNILRARLASDDKYVRRIAKRVTGVATARTPDEHANAALLLRTDLQLFSAHIDRLRATAQDTSEREKTEYRTQVADIHEKCGTVRADIAALRDELAAAQRTRRNRLEYDSIAQKILVYPSRDALESAIKEQEQHIASLAADTGALEQAAADAHTELAHITANMRALHATLKQKLAQSSGKADSDAKGSTTDTANDASDDNKHAHTDATDAPASLNPEAASFEPHTPQSPRKRTHDSDEAPAKRTRRGRRE